MNSTQLRAGKLFEYVVAVLLHRNGYRAGVPQRYLQGRGTKHQIDVLAIDPLPMPFVFPTRILSEAKCYCENGGTTLGVSYVRNLFAEVTDLQQTLPRQKKISLEPSYDEPVSCVYSGALFSTIAFSKPAIEFANSYAISLIPLPSAIESTHLRTLTQKLREFSSPSASPSNVVSGCPGDCFRDLPFPSADIQNVLNIAGNDILKLKKAADRRIFVYALDSMIRQCSKLGEMNETLSIHRIASIGSMLVLVEISEPDFRALARSLAEHFLGRSDGGFGNFATVGIPPEREQRLSHGGVHPGRVSSPTITTAPVQRGFERFSLNAFGVDMGVLANKGVYKRLSVATEPSYFTMMLDFGLVLHVQI